jgi:hypothetical protein
LCSFSLAAPFSFTHCPMSFTARNETQSKHHERISQEFLSVSLQKDTHNRTEEGRKWRDNEREKTREKFNIFLSCEVKTRGMYVPCSEVVRYDQHKREQKGNVLSIDLLFYRNLNTAATKSSKKRVVE